jgi:hypothetical protein
MPNLKPELQRRALIEFRSLSLFPRQEETRRRVGAEMRIMTAMAAATDIDVFQRQLQVWSSYLGPS